MEKISPEKYRQILEGIELQNILLSEIKASVKHELFTEKMKINIKDESEYEFKDDKFIVINKYVLTSRNNKQKKNALKIEATFKIFFESENEINDGFFEIYREISLPLNIWPYFRELVNSITARMNIPPLTLPLLKR